MADNNSMDKRCPRSLKTEPTSWCPLAVMRLKAIRNAGRELTEDEEANLPGCPWAINHQLANYCFFKFMSEYGDGNQASDNEIAALLYLSPETVKKVEKTSLNKVREQESFKELKANLDEGESVVQDRYSDDDLTIYT